MRIRIRGPSGQSTATMSEDSTVDDLKVKITQTTSVTSFSVKYGYPPRELSLDDYPGDTPLLDLRLDGEQLTVSERSGAVSIDDTEPGSTKAIPQAATGSKTIPPPTTSAPAPLSISRKQAPEDPPELSMPSRNATLVLRIMPDDNSCLFRAFNSAYFGIMDNMHELRSVIAQNIQANPGMYTSAVLDKEPDEYCRWIQHPDSWGGSIELQILSQHFDVEICSIDVQTLRVDRYNEGQPQRCILVYSGIHYDVVALTPSDSPFTRDYVPPEYDTKIFSAADDEVVEKAKALCKILQGRGYFTDTAGFRIRCQDCGGIFTGEKGALEHARSTGHGNFSEA